MQQPTYDGVWDDWYARGSYQHAPYDSVVTFLFRNAPKNKPQEEVHILEIGCGTAANLFFAAQQGFSVTGLDASPLAIQKARERFAAAGLSGCLEIGDFTSLPFENRQFDLVIDRAAITHTTAAGAVSCVNEIARVIKPGGRFFFNPYSDRASSAASGIKYDITDCGGGGAPGGFRKNITEGTLSGVGQLCFYSLSDIHMLFSKEKWKFLEVKHAEWFDLLDPYRNIHADYRVVVERNAGEPAPV